jgi:hypothetical protein
MFLRRLLSTYESTRHQNPEQLCYRVNTSNFTLKNRCGQVLTISIQFRDKKDKILSLRLQITPGTELLFGIIVSFLRILEAVVDILKYFREVMWKFWLAQYVVSIGYVL